MGDWKPREYDIHWTKTTLTTLKIGGVWTSSYYTIRKLSENTFEFDHLNREHPKFKFHYKAIKKVMTEIGWILNDPIK
jgi:DNA modification methylase